MAKPLVETKARVGVFSIALQAYLPQFPQLVPEFEQQYADFKKTLPPTIEIVDGGMVTTKEQSMAAGDKFRAADVDLVILQMPSSSSTCRRSWHPTIRRPTSPHGSASSMPAAPSARWWPT